MSRDFYGPLPTAGRVSGVDDGSWKLRRSVAGNIALTFSDAVAAVAFLTSPRID